MERPRPRPLFLGPKKTPVPLIKSLRKTSNKVLANIENLDTADTRCRCRHLVDVNTVRGHKSPQSIDMQCNSMYNNLLYSRCTRHRSSQRIQVYETPFQPLAASDTDNVLCRS